MNINHYKHAVAGIFAFGLSMTALALPEIEPNDSISSAQVLKGDTSFTIEGMMGNIGDVTHNDFDFYSFEAKAGDVLNIDIDNGYGGIASIDTILAVFSPTHIILRMNDNTSTLDEGSTSTADARIDSFVVPETGSYTIGVSTYPRYFGRMILGDTTNNAAGDYTLNISGITSEPRMMNINIEVKPGSEELAPLNPKGKGKIPVAIMGSNEFDVHQIRHSSLRFGSTGNEKSLSKCQRTTDDINGDNYRDLVCHFNNNLAAFKSGDIEGILKGKTESGIKFEGRALIKVLPSQRK